MKNEQRRSIEKAAKIREYVMEPINFTPESCSRRLFANSDRVYRNPLENDDLIEMTHELFCKNTNLI